MLEAWLFVAEDSIEAADQLMIRSKPIRERCFCSRKWAGLGTNWRLAFAADLRSWPTSTPYLLFYFVDGERITVARVLHHARDIPAIWSWPRH